MLTVERKAELFDYLASRLDEMKLQLDFGGSEWFYHEQGSPEDLADLLEQAQEWEAGDPEGDNAEAYDDEEEDIDAE